MKFEEALGQMKAGKKIKRKGSDYAIELADDEIWVVGGELHDNQWYTASDNILADDWEAVDE